MNKKHIQDELVKLWLKDLGQHETGGANRSPMIDSLNKRMGVSLGSPYCMSGLLVRGVEAFCKVNRLKNPVVMTASTQSFYNLTKEVYKKTEIKKASKGDIVILQNRNSTSSGHAYALTEDAGLISHKTIEYNTNKAGSRDGDGVYENTRYPAANISKRYRGAVDVAQMIMDANPNIGLESSNSSTTPTFQQTDVLASLSWENTTAPRPERKPWSVELISCIKKDLSLYKKAADIKKISPRFDLLTEAQQIKTVAEFFVALAFYESGYNPKSKSVDVGTQNDLNSWSVGLYQMSGNDSAAKVFKADYIKLQDPLTNIKVATEQMRRQLTKTNTILLPNKSPNRYWATILIGNRFSKIDKILPRVIKNTKF